MKVEVVGLYAEAEGGGCRRGAAGGEELTVLQAGQYM